MPMFWKPPIQKMHCLALAAILLPLFNGEGQTNCEAQTLAKKAVATNLNHPSGIAIHPNDESIYVADSGHGNVVRFMAENAEIVVSNYPVTQDAKILNTVGGPQSLGFLENGKHLIVGSSGWAPDNDRIDIYEVDALPANQDSPHASFQILAENSPDKKSQGDFFGIAWDESTAWLTGRGSPEIGWIYEISKNAASSDQAPRCAVKTWNATQSRYPTALAITPAGFLLVGLRGDLENPSVLGFFDRDTGQLRARFDIGKPGLIALAYHPINGKLYGLINNPKDPDRNGLYKLVARKRNTACEAQLQVRIPDPWAMAFSKSGELWVTGGRESGTLWQISQSGTPEKDCP